MLKKINELNQNIQKLNIEKSHHEQQLKESAKEARADSIKKQRATIKGQISETIAPWSMTVVDSVSELNFLGKPIDFIGFKGLDGNDEIGIKFIEVKSGTSALSKNQRRIRDAVKAKRIEWVEVKVSEIQIEEKII